MSHRPGLSQVWRVLVVLVVTAGALLLLSDVLDGFDVNDVGSALVTAVAIGLINALVWPVAIRIALPFTVLTLGLGVLVLNGAIVMAVGALEPGVEVSRLGVGVVVAFGLTVVNTAVTSLLAIDDEDFWYRNVVRRQAARRRAEDDFDVPGVYFLEIDGLAHDVLKRAIRDGNAPNLARWLREGSHRLMAWETDWSSQTGACQAGLLHGEQRRHPGLPLVGEGPQRGDRDQPPARRRRDRAAPLGRPRAAARGRGEPGEHRLRGRPAHAAHDEHGARPPPRGAHRPGLLRLLRQPLQRHAHHRPGDRRHRAGALVRRAAAPARRPAAHRARPQVRAGACVGHGDPDRPAGAGGGLRPLRRPPGRLLHLPGLRRGGPPLGGRARRRPVGPAQGGPADRPHRHGRARCPAALPLRDPLRPRPVPGGDLPRPLRGLPRGPGAGGVRRAPRRGVGGGHQRGLGLPQRFADRESSAGKETTTAGTARSPSSR